MHETTTQHSLSAASDRITVGEMQKRLHAGEQFTFIDTRNPQAWEQSDKQLPGALRMDADTTDEQLSQVPDDRSVVTYCT